MGSLSIDLKLFGFPNRGSLEAILLSKWIQVTNFFFRLLSSLSSYILVRLRVHIYGF